MGQTDDTMIWGDRRVGVSSPLENFYITECPQVRYGATKVYNYEVNFDGKSLPIVVCSLIIRHYGKESEGWDTPFPWKNFSLPECPKVRFGATKLYKCEVNFKVKVSK